MVVFVWEKWSVMFCWCMVWFFCFRIVCLIVLIILSCGFVEIVGYFWLCSWWYFCLLESESKLVLCVVEIVCSVWIRLRIWILWSWMVRFGRMGKVFSGLVERILLWWWFLVCLSIWMLSLWWWVLSLSIMWIVKIRYGEVFWD